MLIIRIVFRRVSHKVLPFTPFIPLLPILPTFPSFRDDVQDTITLMSSQMIILQSCLYHRAFGFLFTPSFLSLLLFEMQLALLTAGDFAQWFGFDLMTSVALQLIFLAVTSVITFRTSQHLCLHK